MKILKLEEELCDTLVKCLNKYDKFWNEKILQDEFNNENSEYYVLVNNDDIIGFGGLWFNIDEAHIMNIAVREDLRKNGYGTVILNYLVEIAKERKKTCITLEVRENNLAAIGLYEKIGFEVVGRRKKYYENKFDAIIMTKYF